MIVLLLAPPALANGLTTHVHISLAALAELPDGELRDVLTRADLEPYLVNGTMFPDGGYGVGDDYGEMAHWEPLQGLYLEWIRETWPEPWADDEGARHVAFLMGMASHGMADQVFDALYMERAKQHDAASDWAGLSMDTATDVVYASLAGAIVPPERWVPTDALVPLFAERGHTVDDGTLLDGQALTAVAVAWVGATGALPDEVETYRAQFPWATAHLLDAGVPGSPPIEARVVARYWQAIWARLHGEDWAEEPVLWTFPEDGGLGHARDANTVEARVSVVFARGLVVDSVTPERFAIAAADGAPAEVATSVFYGGDSHVVHATPAADWAEDADYTLTLGPGVTAIDGTVLDGGFSFDFSTRPPPPEEEAPPATAAVPEDGCACGTPGLPASALLGGLAAAVARVRRRR